MRNFIPLLDCSLMSINELEDQIEVRKYILSALNSAMIFTTTCNGEIKALQQMIVDKKRLIEDYNRAIGVI